MQVSIGNIPLPLVEELNFAPNIFGITAANPIPRRSGADLIFQPSVQDPGGYLTCAATRRWPMGADLLLNLSSYSAPPERGSQIAASRRPFSGQNQKQMSTRLNGFFV
jgi:hypothetical protein